MPILLVGAETAAGRAAATALLHTGGQVRLYLDAERCGDDDAVAWRARGAKVALGTPDDEGHLEAALEQVHTVVHLAIDPLADPGPQLEALATVASAAIGAGCRRLVWVTELAASEPGNNPYLQMLAEAGALVAGLPMETITFRCALRYGPDDRLTRALAAARPGLGARHAPLLVDDLASAVVAADAARETTQDLDVEVELVGPTELSLADFAARLAAALGAARRAAVLGAPPGANLPEAVLDWLSRDATGGPHALGRQGTPLEEGLARLRGPS